MSIRFVIGILDIAALFENRPIMPTCIFTRNEGISLGPGLESEAAMFSSHGYDGTFDWSSLSLLVSAELFVFFFFHY